MTEAERGLADVLSVALPEDRDKVLLAIYGALSLGTTPDEMVERLVNAPQEASSAYFRGRRDQHEAMVRHGWRAPEDVGLSGFAARLLRKVRP